MPKYSFHKASAVFPMMSDDEFAGLKDDIRQHGQKQPIYLFNGEVIDGRNRLKACQELGIEPQFQRIDLGKMMPVDLVLSLNLHRRHLDKQARKAIAEIYRERGLSYREIGEKLGVNATTVMRDVEKPPVANATPEHSAQDVGESSRVSDDTPIPPKVKGRDGKEYPATKVVKPFSIGEAIQKLQSDMEKHRMKWPRAQRHEYVKAVTHYMKLAGSITEEKWS
jgi:hypothetical protein